MPCILEVDGTIIEAKLPSTLRSGVVTCKFLLIGQPKSLDKLEDVDGKIKMRKRIKCMTQWFPKICEYDHEGWHSNPYIGREFHGVWGDYDVEIKLPKGYQVGATGVLQSHIHI